MSPLPDRPASLNHPPATEEFSAQERRQLLHAAHEAVEAALESREIRLAAPSPRLLEPRGAFTTIYVRGELHGCVGYALPTTPLYRTIVETARAAAFDDPRFAPLTREELPVLQVSLSILSLLSPIHPEQIEIGRHGLLISQGACRGLLLPQVPVEHRWDRFTFLQQICRKAGLPPDAWRTNAKLEAFTAEVFGDANVH